jgi:UDP-2,3-diacylglucosamine pyrophosphatase LpxH
MSLLLRIASDLHLEGFRGQSVERLVDHFLPLDARDAAAVLVLAGDVSPDIDQLAEFMRLVAPRFARVLYVPGNHEYYRGEYFDWNSRAAENLRRIRGLSFAVDLPGVIEHGGVRFVFATLWGDGGDTSEQAAAIATYLNDFRLIRYGNAAFTVQCMGARHHEQRKLLAELLESDRGGPRAVVTHHMPSYALSHPRFGNVATGGFAGKCDDMLKGPNAPQLWIHGHTHDTIDRKLHDTRVVCNPAGYYPEWGTQFNNFFAAPKFVEVDVV